MLKFVSYDIVFQEVPNEVTLAINLSLCPNRCVGCHSPHLRDDIGTELTEQELDLLIDNYRNNITCVCFMGGDHAPLEVAHMAQTIRQCYGLKTAWYSGRDVLPSELDARCFDFIKLGHYDKRYGGLKSQSTNQKFFRVVSGKLEDATHLFWRGVLFLIFWFCPFTASSTEKPDSISNDYTIDEIVVTTKPLDKDIILPQRFSGKELEQLNSLSVADAIRYFSGVQIKDYGGIAGIKTINVRSMGTQHVGVYYNGIQLGNAQNGQVDLGKFSLENIEEITLYNGQKSDILQSAREFGSAGSIYLNSRCPKFRNDKKIHLRASVKGGSFKLFNPSILLDARLTEAISLSLNAEYVASNGEYKFRYRRVTPTGELAYDTTAVRHNGDIHAMRIESGLSHYYTSTGWWKCHAYLYNSERGIPGAIVNNVWRNGERLWDRNAFFQASWQDQFFERWDIKANAKYANDFTHYINNDEKLLKTDNTYVQQEAYVTISNKVAVFNWWDLALAYDYQWNSLSEHLSARRHSHWLSLATAMNVANHLRIQASILGTFVNDKNNDTNRQSKTSKFTPGLFLSYQPWTDIHLRLNAFYKQAYRYPTFNDLYYTDMGNAALRPELSTQHNVGISYQTPKRSNAVATFSTDVEVYYNKVKDKIVAYPKGQQFRWTMLNLGLVKIYGIDCNAQLHLHLPKSWGLTTKLQYTYQKAIDVTNAADSYYKHQIPYTPEHSASAIVMLSWRNYALNYSFIYVGERYSQQENIVYNYVQPWYTHDISLTGEWDVRSVRLKSTLEVNNLLGQDYEVIRNYPMPKQNFKLSFVVEY